jgi:hypothetical protein
VKEAQRDPASSELAEVSMNGQTNVLPVDDSRIHAAITCGPVSGNIGCYRRARASDRKRAPSAVAIVLLALSQSLCRNVEPQGQRDTTMRLTEESKKLETDDNADVVSVHYSRSFDRFGSMFASVERDGTGRLSLSFNSDGPNEIGSWQAPLGPNVFAEWLRRLRASNYRGIETQRAWTPGMSGVNLGERREGDPDADTRTFMRDQPEVAEVFAYIDAVLVKLREHPLRVLRGEARWRRPELTRDGAGEIDFKLSNGGVEPLQISNPAYGEGEAGSGLRLMGEGLYLDLKAVDVRATTGAPAGPSLHLRPGESVSFSLRVKMPRGPGRFHTSLRSVSRAGAPQHSAGAEIEALDTVEGQMFIDLGEVSIPP